MRIEFAVTLGALAAAFVLLAPAQSRAAIDCAKLKAGTEPFQLVSKAGEKVTDMQVYPDKDGGATALLAAGDVVVRQQFRNGLLVASRRKSPREDLRLRIDNSAKGDPFGQKKSFAYDETIDSTGIPGVPSFKVEQSTQASYIGAQDVTISGCTFHLLHYTTKTVPKDQDLTTEREGPQQSQVTTGDKLYAPDLHLILVNKVRVTANGSIVSNSAFDPFEIDTNFKPFANPGE